MNNKLLVVKHYNNIIIYKVSYKKEDLCSYIKYLDSLYSYNETKRLETTIIDGKVLSMGKYDSLKKYCKIDENYKLLEDIKVIDNRIKMSKIEINIHYYSKISEIFKKIFLNENILIDTTEFIKLCNHLFNIPNSFEFNEALDLKDTKKSWDDPSRYIFNEEEYNKYIETKKKNLNTDDIKLNKKEKKYVFDNMASILENTKHIFKAEQIGMFPIEEDMSQINEIFYAFGKRNQEFEYLYGSLEDVPINIDGARIINELSHKICNDYNCQSDIENKGKINLLSQVNSFLKF